MDCGNCLVGLSVPYVRLLCGAVAACSRHLYIPVDCSLAHLPRATALPFPADSPSLSSEQSFALDVVEAWALQPPDDEGTGGGGGGGAAAGGRGGGGGALSKAREDRALLELAGVSVNHSAALGPAEPIEE